jgi:hypothetical protein
MGALDLVDWPADRTLTLSGSTGALRIPLALRNSSAEPLQLAEVSLADVRLAGGGAPLRTQPAPIQLSVAGNGVTRAQLRLRLDPATPPGRYEGEVTMAGLRRTVAIDVLPEVKLGIRPAPVVVDAAAGPEQRFTVAFENRGNVPLTIDLTGDYPLGEEVPIAPDRIDKGSAAGNPLAAIFDRVIGRAPAPTLVPFGALKLAMPGGPELLQPGEARTAQVSVSLPKDLSPIARYHLFAPLYAVDLHIVVVTGAKPPIPAKPARRPKGVPA